MAEMDVFPSIALMRSTIDAYDNGQLSRTSAYGLSSAILNPSEGVAAANLAAAESLPIFPVDAQFEERIEGRIETHPIRSCCNHTGV